MYYVIILSERTFTGPMQFREAIKEKDRCDSFGMSSIIARSVVDVEGKMV